jgi:hypothetical protein
LGELQFKAEKKKSLPDTISFCLFFFGAGIEPRALGMLGNHCTTKLHPSPQDTISING